MPQAVLLKDEYDRDKIRLYTMMTLIIGGREKTKWCLDAVFHEDAIEDVFGSHVAHEIDQNNRTPLNVAINTTIIEE